MAEPIPLHKNYVAPRKEWSSHRGTTVREQIGERLFNLIVTHVPVPTVRLAWLRLFGARIGAGTSIKMGTRALGIESLIIGEHCAIGSRCLLDARGDITIGDNVVIGSEVTMICGQHVVNSDDFGNSYCPITISHHVVVGSRSTVVVGVDIGVGAVVGVGSLVRDNVAPMSIVSGVPARQEGVRLSALNYRPTSDTLAY